MNLPPSPLVKTPRSDGVEARKRLLFTALKLFAEKGFSQTSTREIALAANANIGAISYYFGDKAGLYRAVFTEPMGSPKDDISRYDQPHFTLRESLEGFFASFLEPMKQGELMQHCVRLHNREMIEPTGVWAQEVEQGIKPAHMALVSVLRRHLGLARTDDSLHHLAFAIAAPALQMLLCREVFEAIAPQLVDSPGAIDRAAARMADFAEFMVAGEKIRRASTLPPKVAAKDGSTVRNTARKSSENSVKKSIRKTA
jgi:TetR/AcrR family transcriptional regulator, regulator of cefoperazone and chloramphenicol sensitivity